MGRFLRPSRRSSTSDQTRVHCKYYSSHIEISRRNQERRSIGNQCSSWFISRSPFSIYFMDSPTWRKQARLRPFSSRKNQARTDWGDCRLRRDGNDCIFCICWIYSSFYNGHGWKSSWYYLECLDHNCDGYCWYLNTNFASIENVLYWVMLKLLIWIVWRNSENPIVQTMIEDSFNDVLSNVSKHNNRTTLFCFHCFVFWVCGFDCCCFSYQLFQFVVSRLQWGFFYFSRNYVTKLYLNYCNVWNNSRVFTVFVYLLYLLSNFISKNRLKNFVEGWGKWRAKYKTHIPLIISFKKLCFRNSCIRNKYYHWESQNTCVIQR